MPRLYLWVGLLVAGVLITVISQDARADRWMPAQEFSVESENGKFVAHLSPSVEKAPKVPAGLTVHKKGEEAVLWNAALSNIISPVDAMITNDGEHVITFDNWAGAGYGPDVLAFYDKTGLRKQYSLDAIAEQSGNDPRRAKMDHSVSSFWWRQHHVCVFDQQLKPPMLGMWFDWSRQWVVWNGESGDPVTITPDIINRLNTQAREKMLAALKPNPVRKGQEVTAIMYLEWLRNPLDKTVMEEQLAHDDFSTSMFPLPSGTIDDPEPTDFQSDSPAREAADKALANWNGKDRSKRAKYTFHHEYTYLGNVYGSLELPDTLFGEQVSVWLYLVPETVDKDQWAKAQLLQRLNIDDFFLSNWATEKRRLRQDQELGKILLFRINGVQPGRYWLKAVYNRTAPFSPRDTKIYVPHAGDYESESRAVIEVKAGVVTQAGSIRCLTPVANTP